MKLFGLEALVLFYLHIAQILWYPGHPIQCSVGAVVCEKSTSKKYKNQHRFGLEGVKCFQDIRKSNFTAKCLNTFVAYCIFIERTNIQNFGLTNRSLQFEYDYSQPSVFRSLFSGTLPRKKLLRARHEVLSFEHHSQREKMYIQTKPSEEKDVR